MVYIFNIKSFLNCISLWQSLVFKYEFFLKVGRGNPFGWILSINMKKTNKWLHRVHPDFFILCRQPYVGSELEKSTDTTQFLSQAPHMPGSKKHIPGYRSVHPVLSSPPYCVATGGVCSNYLRYSHWLALTMAKE